MYRYTAYGLAVASDLALPELAPAINGAAEGPPDLVVRLGATPDRIEAPAASRVLWSARPGAWLHEVPGVGRFFVHRDGREVVVERRGGTDVDLRAFLFGTTIGAVLHQRGLFVLHASAAVVGDGAVAVAGGSGAGKSTTLAALAARGHAVLSDDKTAVRFGDGGRAEVLSGYPTLRLWRDAAERVGADPDALPAVREGMQKVLAPAATFHGSAAPLRAIVVLVIRDGGDPQAAERIDGQQALGAILRQTYRLRIVHGSGQTAAHFQWAARLAATVPVVRVGRPRHADSVDAVVAAVEAAAG